MLNAQILVSALLAVSAMAGPVMVRDASDGDIARLTPDFGFSAGRNPTGTGDCDGAVVKNGQPIKIPCSCPPPRDQFISKLQANVHAGHATNNPGVQVTFPTDDSNDSRIARLTASLITLQNLNGPGVGCPAVSTTFSQQQDDIRAGRAGPPPPPPPPPPQAAPPPPPQNNGDDFDRLAPQFGLQAGLNPTGTGDCDGVNGVKIPCSCPPPRDVFINQLRDNARAGHAIKNPGVGVSFPTGDSNGDKIARLQAGIITLQNLNGPGVGCPAVSTTFLQQIQALQ